jgi:exodeoxyribonuclease V alpha subunit
MVSIITGGPGVGKTYVISHILQHWLAEKCRVALAAPTGKAAKRMEEATGHPARTIHRLLEFNFQDGEFAYNEICPLPHDVLIIDETSMIDIKLMKSLLDACRPGMRLIFVGDVDQLPSVGPGAVLMDMINSEFIKTTYLKTLHRQAERSLINVNAKLINSGEYFRLTHDGDKDFWFIEEDDPKKIREKIVQACTNMPLKKGFSPDDIQVLAPMKKSDIGIHKLNEALRPILNPSSEKEKPIPETDFYVDDRVIQLKNNYNLEIFNGDMGKIMAYNPTERFLYIQFNDIEGYKMVNYPTYMLDELTLAYALTIHKSQGSEFPVVVIPLHTQNYIMLKRNLLYTGITRGKKMVVLIGSKKAAHIAIKTLDSHKRNTRLAERIKNGKDAEEKSPGTIEG